MSITLRSEKGSALTHAEMDENFDILRQVSSSLATLLTSLQSPTPTPTNTVTPTPSPSDIESGGSPVEPDPSPTPTTTTTPSVTVTPTSSTTPNASTSPTPTTTPSTTVTPTITPSVTVTPTSSTTPNASTSPTPTTSVTATPTPTVSTTPTPSGTPETTVTPTPTTSVTVTPTPTPSPVYETFIISGSGDVGDSSTACASPITFRYKITDIDDSGIIVPTAGDFIYEYHPELSPESSSVPTGRYIGLENGTYVLTTDNSIIDSIGVCPSVTPTPTPSPSNTPTFYTTQIAGEGLGDLNKEDNCSSLTTIEIYTRDASSVEELQIGNTLYNDPNTVFANRWVGDSKWYGIGASNGTQSTIIVQIDDNGEILDLISCTSVTPTPTPSPSYPVFIISGSGDVDALGTACSSPINTRYKITDIDGSGVSTPTAGDSIFEYTPELSPASSSIGSGRYIGLEDGTYVLTTTNSLIDSVGICPSVTPTPTPTPSNTPTFYSSHTAGNGLSDLEKNEGCSSLGTIQIYTNDATSVGSLQTGHTLYSDPNTVPGNVWVGNSEWYGIADSNGNQSSIIVQISNSGVILDLISCTSVTPTPTPSPSFSVFIISGSGDVDTLGTACSSPITTRYKITDIDGSGVSVPTAGDSIYEYTPELSPASSSIASGRYIGLEDGTYVLTTSNSLIDSVGICPSVTPTPTPTPSNTPTFYSSHTATNGLPDVNKTDGCSSLGTTQIYTRNATSVGNLQIGHTLYNDPNTVPGNVWVGNSEWYGLSDSNGSQCTVVVQVNDSGVILDIYTCP